ncbi:M14 family zinc carboxypeptidase [Thalassotalea sp. PP2-459]|uniref:M14 family zinc carboxypeptidase n=1 Tax=Thalassotalea sp. PP2-459 TaxID=1742724 RepID=UPI000941D953|nr:M14 family zinc carboxypeptidase [Thalassotalea sp. PP2-459]OKY26223.1 hypothetical protein BI291_13165 [Thalassotalea sp. PP2-459]
MQRFFEYITIVLACGVIATVNNTYANPVVDAIFDESTVFDSTIKSPSSFLGHRLGDQMVRNDRMIAYFKYLSEQSKRINYEVIGYSNEKRPIVTLTITSIENHKNLANIRNQHLRLQQGKIKPDADMPVISWINFGVHGGEVSSNDSAIPIAYHLAAAEGENIDRLLNNSVILLTASMNPDGNSREASWNLRYSSQATVSDPNHALHGSPWPSGRTNHYWFDLNRQWMLQQQPEPVGWVKKFHQWRPNIVADFHEMRSYKSFYFHPGAPDRIHPIINKKAMNLLSDVVQGPRDFLDKQAEPYFNEEAYDNFYLGKGATYPHIYGSLGILFEQASSAGVLATPRGLLSFRDNIRTYYHVGLELLNNAVDKKEELLQFQQHFAAQTKEMAADDKVKAYVFTAPDDPARMFHFLQLLERNQIMVKPLIKDLALNDIHFKAKHSYIVEVNQASYRMVKGLFSKVTEFENNTFYDVSGWTMPLAFGIVYQPLTRKNYHVDESIKVKFPVQPTVTKATVAYAFDWSHYYAPKVLYKVLSEGYRPRIANSAFKASTAQGVKTFKRGSVVINVGAQGGGNPVKLHQLMAQAAQDGVPVYALNSSHTQSTGMDLGSNNIAPVSLPKVLLVIGPGMSQYQAGEVWHLLDKRMRIPVVLLEKWRLNNVALADYTHLVMVNGKYSDISTSLTSKLTNWVKSGGTIVGIGDGAKWAGKQLLNLKTVKFNRGKGSNKSRIDYAKKSMLEAQDVIGGAVMAGDLDITHPLGYGYSSRYIASHRSGLLAFEPPKNPYATVVKITDEPLLTGFASTDNQQQLAGKSMLVGQRLGQGSVIVFSDDPNFRGYFYGTEKLFMNSLFFSKLFEKPRSITAE